MKHQELKTKVASGIIFIIIGISFLISDFIVKEREEAFSRVNIEINELLTKAEEEKQEEIISEQIEPEPEPQPEEPPIDINQYESFAGILEIPKIGFSKGFYYKESELNNVKFNLKILDASSYPNEEKGNVIIIGHSGNYSNSYFSNLYQLELSDTASISYKNKKYNYKVVNIYNETKDGTITIYRDETKSCLTLITCTKDDDTKQTVYILERTSIE